MLVYVRLIGLKRIANFNCTTSRPAWPGITSASSKAPRFLMLRERSHLLAALMMEKLNDTISRERLSEVLSRLLDHGAVALRPPSDC